MGNHRPFLPVVQVVTQVLIAAVNGIGAIRKVEGKNAIFVYRAEGMQRAKIVGDHSLLTDGFKGLLVLY